MSRIYLFLLALLWGLPAWGQTLPPGTMGAACLATAAAPTLIENRFGALSCDLTGALRTVGGGGGGTSPTTTTSGALQPPTAAAGKITRTSTALTANTSTTIAAANANRIALGIQCGAGAVSIDETGGALTAAGVGNGTLFIPSGTAPYFTPPIATLTAVTAYTATAQTCVVTEYLR